MMDYDEEDGYRELELERDAERLTEDSFGDAIEDYRDSAKSLIFDEAYEATKPGEESVTFGKKLADRLTLDEKKLRVGIIRTELFGTEEYDMLLDALKLPFEMHYKVYTYVGSGGNSEKGEEYDEDEAWDSTDENDIRDDLVEALYQYTLSAAAMARRVNDSGCERLFLMALKRIEVDCRRGHENEVGGMGEKTAEETVKWIATANDRLWGRVESYRRLRYWEAETNGTLPKLTPEAKRYDYLLAKSFAGTLFPSEAEEFKELSGKPTFVPTPEPAPPEPQPEEEVQCGSWTSKFAEIDVKTRTLTITTPEKEKKVFHVPLEYTKAWQILKWLLECQEDKGWFSFPEEYDYYRDSWRKQFNHNGKPNAEMIELLRYIHSGKTAGQRGPTKLHLTNVALPKRKHRKRKKAAKKSAPPASGNKETASI